MSKKYIKNCTGNDCEKTGRGSFLLSRIIFYFLLFCFVSVVVFVLFFTQYLQISTVSVSGTKELDGGKIRQIVEESFDGKYVGVIPKNNFLLISRGSVERLLENDFKKIRSVGVVKKFPDSIEIIIDERKALLVWCSNEKCFLVDEKGTAYNEADFNSQEFLQNNLIRIEEKSMKEIASGSEIVGESYEKFVLEARDSLGPVGFEANGNYSTPSRMAEEIRIGTKEGPELYFSTQFELKNALRSLAVVVKKENLESRIGDLEYIDLRSEGKVFYKFKNQNPEENPQAEISELEKEKTA